jgi:hypothetical protein
MARVLVEMIYKREKIRKETLLLEHVIFEQRALVQEMKEQLGLPEELVEVARTIHRVCWFTKKYFHYSFLQIDLQSAIFRETVVYSKQFFVACDKILWQTSSSNLYHRLLVSFEN